MARDLTFSAVVCDEFGGPEVMKVQSKTLPAPGPGELRVRIGAAGINPSDTYSRLGPAGPYAGTKLLPEPPFTPGKDGAGVVESVGAGCRFSVGDRVYLYGSITGTYAEYALCKEAQAFPMPSNVSASQGACMGVPGTTAYRALMQRCQAKSGEAVLVHGASGAVGLAAVQLARAAGCTVIGTAGTPAGMEAVRAAGANGVVCHKEDGYLQKAKSLSPGGAGFNVCLEMMASSNLASDLTVMALCGRVGIIGSKAATIPINPRAAMPLELNIMGVFAGNASAEEVTEAHAQLYKALESGALKPVVSMRLPLEEAGKGHVEVMTPSAGGATGNIVLAVTDEEI
mmetsp:Transcript_22252/g.61737  ORF Transcript_22252/g.61737 Transcript_22252/m.61737 type:complete len:342 (+) Transcript_22252:207-1232(+)|eukprot:CAMPEP_0117667424 /NCGR_PEP_ID=MMETSP0804-20121206/10960_1 /TAXON_ID=1074897 /ORGANISM="Tetraselmis astigmatica, Strain CCMP880" /LENGTH=341 /DNA_ID=CAMNT_0005475151 /DNA_START=179 /DNA_END=1204 /DNA_ORIENTATION=-